jgi:hypothetical protein
VQGSRGVRVRNLAVLRKHPVLVGLVTLVVVLLYARVSGAWFCGYDDFSEAHRAAFQDSVDPMRILTTTHDVGYMYRPVTSALQYLTWNLFHHSPLAFRLRNLGMHLVSVAMLYGIVWLIAESRVVAVGAALLFGLNPMVNETIVVAIWTNATAYALLFASLFLFLYSLRSLKRNGNWSIPLLVSLVCALVALFTYEPTIAIFGLMFCYLGVWKARGLRLTRPYLSVLFFGSALELVAFFVIRHVFITSAAPLNPPSIVLRNAMMYCVALMTPVDFVLANALFGIPLPSELRIGAKLLILPAVIGIALLVIAILLVRHRRFKAAIARIDRPVLLFLVVGIPIGVLPTLLFREHPSEHDLYLSAAFYATLISLVIWQMTRSRLIYGLIILSLAISFSAATWVRNERVQECAVVAERILTQLPVARWRDGSWHIFLATTPGERLSQPYGAYNDYGLHSLQTETGSTPGAQDAVQIAANNERIRVSVVKRETIARSCIEPSTCFWVSTSGEVTGAETGKRR